MAEHDGSFINAASDDSSLDGSFTLPSNFGRLPSESEASKRRPAGDWQHAHAKIPRLPKPEPTLATLARKLDFFADPEVMSDLGITGMIEDDDVKQHSQAIPMSTDQQNQASSNSEMFCNIDDVLNLFPTPSPGPPAGFVIKNRRPDGRTTYAATDHNITKKRALLHFDSPEEKQRGLSELNFRLRNPFSRFQSQITGEGLFNHLADEMVLCIFKMMPKPILAKCAKVCKRWRRLAYDETLWRRLDLGNRLVPARILGDCVMNRGVEYLRLSGAEIMGPIFTSNKRLRISKLQYLDLSMATVAPSALEDIIRYSKHLKKLSLENLSISNNVCRLISHNSLLSVLNLAMVQGLTSHGLQLIFDNCKKLEELNIAWTKLSTQDVHHTVRHIPPTVTKLNMSGCRDNIIDDDVAMLASINLQLIELDISDSLGITDASIEYIYNGLPNLQVLHISRCYYIHPEVLRCLRHKSNLKELSIFSMMQQDNLEALISYLVNLQINTVHFSSVARPTVAPHRTSIWGNRVSDLPV